MRERWALGKEERWLKFDLIDPDTKTSVRRDILRALDALDAAETRNAAYRGMVVRLLGASRWAEPTCVYCLGVRPDHGPACPEVAAQALLLSPDPAQGIVERLAAGAKLGADIREALERRKGPEPVEVMEFEKTLVHEVLCGVNVEIALAAYDKAVRP